MASTTFTLPNGVKVRTQTRRRFVLISAYTGTSESGARFKGAYVEKRSDRKTTLIQHVTHLRNRVGLGFGPWYLGDTVEKTVEAL